jgi:SP family myo-inositol transporter-like MFS transporter 13
LTALLSSPLSGPPADAFGRKVVIITCDGLFIAGAIIQAFAHSVVIMTLGRAVVGLAIGAAAAIGPLYIAEMSPASWRGRMVTISVLFITAGQVIAYVVGWLFAKQDGGWRWMVGIGGVPAIAQIVALFYVPESPRWLMKVGKEQRARAVLEKIHPKDPKVVDTLIRRINMEIKEEAEALGMDENLAKRVRRTTNELLTDKANRKALTIACLLQGAQQICGFVSNLYSDVLSLTKLSEFPYVLFSDNICHGRV